METKSVFVPGSRSVSPQMRLVESSETLQTIAQGRICRWASSKCWMMVHSI